MKKLLILAFILLTYTSKAQLNLSYRLGYGTYSMKSVAEYQEYILSVCGFPAQIVEQFPGYLTHRFYIGKDMEGSINKAYIGFISTGGRISVSDYSGKWMFDMLLDGYQLGFHIDIPGQRFERFEFNPYFDAGITTTRMELTQYLEVGQEKATESYIFYANEASFQPGLSFLYKNTSYKIGCYVGYEVGIPTAFHLEGNSKAKLGVSENKFTKPQWAGIRTGIEFSYIFKKKRRKAE